MCVQTFFANPPTAYRGQIYDSLVVCVDRLSGWIQAKPTQGRGLTAERTALLLLDGGWEIYGIPSHITCDQGPQFAGQWFRTLCAKLGIRVAYSQTYRPQANGRAEVAGKCIKNLMRKWDLEKTILIGLRPCLGFLIVTIIPEMKLVIPLSSWFLGVNKTEEVCHFFLLASAKVQLPSVKKFLLWIKLLVKN